MKIAVIGSGISGLSAAYFLSQKYHVELFEADSRLGGHAHTVSVIDSQNNTIPVDTGFLVYNELTYPHFTQLLKHLNVESVDSDMSLSIKTQTGLEWSGTNLKSVFAQKLNLFKPSFIKMLFDILKFHKNADLNLKLSKENNWTLKDLVSHNKLSKSFVNLYLLPMTGAIWSMSYEKAFEFPASTFLQFCINHKLLQVNDRPIWKTIKNGSINYVSKLASHLKYIHLNTEVQNIQKDGHQLKINTSQGSFLFDKVIFATSTSITFQILKPHFSELSNNFSKAITSKNNVILHKNNLVMPLNKICWSSWNVKAENSSLSQHPIQLTYYLNKLQPLKTNDNYFITLNQKDSINLIERELIYHHPQFDQNLIDLQNKLALIQGTDQIYFTGAWTRYGFHEDGLLSSVKLMKYFEVDIPWKI